MLGRSCMHARTSASQFLPHNSAASQSLVVVSMQMDPCLKKEQNGTLFVWVGAPKGRFKEGGQGGPAHNLDPLSTNFLSTVSEKVLASFGNKIRGQCILR